MKTSAKRCHTSCKAVQWLRVLGVVAPVPLCNLCACHAKPPVQGNETHTSTGIPWCRIDRRPTCLRPSDRWKSPVPVIRNTLQSRAMMRWCKQPSPMITRASSRVATTSRRNSAAPPEDVQRPRLRRNAKHDPNRHHCGSPCCKCPRPGVPTVPRDLRRRLTLSEAQILESAHASWARSATTKPWRARTDCGVSIHM